MFRLRDLFLLLVIYSSLVVGVVLPELSSAFQPIPLYSMMAILFLSFLSVKITDVWRTIKSSTLTIVLFLSFRMIVLPLCIALLFRVIWPAYSLSALLLSGISTGVIAPFISTLVQANTSLVLVVVVISSLLVPFTLPPLVELLFSQSMEISLIRMMRLLFMVVFVPVAIAEILKRVSRSVVEKLVQKQYYISLVLFTVTNLGIFSRYSEFFYQRPMTIAAAAGVSFLLAGIYFVAGLLISWGRTADDQLGTIICFGIINNVLVLVFSSEFFTPLEPTVAAMYMIPVFTLILPLRAYRSWRAKG